MKTLYLIILVLVTSGHIAKTQHLLPFQDEQGKWGYKNKQGEIKIQPKYNWAGKFFGNWARVKGDKGYGIIDKQDKKVIPLIYYALFVIDEQRLICVIRLENRARGVIGKNNQEILPAKYDRIRRLSRRNPHNLLVVTKGDEKALFTTSGKQLTDFIYSEVGRSDNKLIVAERGNNYGFLNPSGKEVIPFVYDEAEKFVKGLALVRKDGRNFYIDEVGRVADKEAKQRIYMIVEENSMPKQGWGKFQEYIAENLRYPSKAKKNGVEGKVYMQFVVEGDGSLSEFKVLKGIGSGCDKEAIRLLKNAPKWNPGKSRGKVVRTRRTMPITFKLKK